MLPKEHRITKSTTFSLLKREGEAYKSKNFNVLFIRDTLPKESKFGVVVSKKVSNISPKRNRIKRIVRALIAENLLELKGSFVFYPKIGVLSTNHSLLLQEILSFKNFFQGYNSSDVK